MKIVTEKWADKVFRLSNWHRKFAWWPKKVGDGEYRWLEIIERKGKRWRGIWFWDYRTTQKDKP